MKGTSLSRGLLGGNHNGKPDSSIMFMETGVHKKRGTIGNIHSYLWGPSRVPFLLILE